MDADSTFLFFKFTSNILVPSRLLVYSMALSLPNDRESLQDWTLGYRP